MTFHDDRYHHNDKPFNNDHSTYSGYEGPQHDDAHQTSETKNTGFESGSTTPPSSNKNKKSRSSLWAILLSGVTGGIVVALVGFFLLNTGLIQLDSHTSNTTATESTETTNSQPNNQNYNTENDVIPTIANERSNSLTNAIEQVSDAVVGVSNIQQAGLWTPTQENGIGSGVIYKKENDNAYVVTNNHVVEGASDIEVILTNGDHVNAKLLGADQLTDLAVLEIDGSNVSQVATLGTSENLIVGDTAIAIGNPLGTEFAGTVTKGIISGLDRSVEMDLNGDRRPDWTTEVLQTDAAINPGNSGGALINSNGEVIGINSMKIAQESVEGIGFAIPIDEAKPVIEQLETDGKIARPFIGISAVSLSTVPSMNKQQTLKLDEEVTDGVVLAEVETGSPADNAGLQRYDVITQIDDHSIDNMMNLKQYLYSEREIGDQVTITYYREGNEQTTTLTLSDN
ncbi:S1C family serine protease [Aquibacillus sediminis]|uniref:S1C family serine protease n=1 Tax=Aquibacillus sediminis TaxID=2574734 RepID=UPI0011087E66|nr:S1C family serine protease [Aquibacillus sediminis]